MGEPGYYTEHGRFDSVVKYLSGGGDVPLRLEGLLERYVRDLNPRDLGPGRGVTGFTVGRSASRNTPETSSAG
jgi:hypothetical protein